MKNYKNLTYYITLLIILFLGIFLRIKLYLVNFDMHCDEAALALDIMEKGYCELFTPLDRHQVAPPMFLVISKLIYTFLKFHPTPNFSDLLLRFFPLLSGILALPLFTYFVSNTFKNKLMTLLSTLLLAINPLAISYSCVFKQYSTEMMISILAMILFAKIDFKKNSLSCNLVLFLILALLPLFSMSVIFIIPIGLCYLLFKSINQKSLKIFLALSAILSLIFGMYLILILLPIYKNHYEYMRTFWNYSFVDASNLFKYISISIKNLFCLDKSYLFPLFVFLFFANSILVLIKRKAYLILGVILVTFMLSANNCYPSEERLILFLLPYYIVMLTYCFSLIPQTLTSKYENIIYIFILAYLCHFCLKIQSIELFVLKQESSKRVWEYYKSHADQTIPLFLGSSVNTNAYYAKSYNQSNFNLWDKIETAPPGVYYLLITRLKNQANEKYVKDMDKNEHIKILTDKIFYVVEGEGHIIKFRKIY